MKPKPETVLIQNAINTLQAVLVLGSCGCTKTVPEMEGKIATALANHDDAQLRAIDAYDRKRRTPPSGLRGRQVQAPPVDQVVGRLTLAVEDGETEETAIVDEKLVLDGAPVVRKVTSSTGIVGLDFQLGDRLLSVEINSLEDELHIGWITKTEDVVKRSADDE